MREMLAALADELPLFKRDGGFVRAGYDAALDEIARAARRIAPGGRAAAGALRRRHRRQVAEDPAQQRARLFRRRHRPARREASGARRSTRPSSTARRWPARSASPPPSSASSKPRSPTPPTARSTSSSRSSSRLAAATIAASDDDQGRRRGAGACSMFRAALATLAVERDYVRPEIDRSLDFVIEGGRHPWSSRRSAIRSSPTIAICRRRGDAKLGAHLAAHRPEHGRQVDVPAPERADRRAGADGLLRAGEARQASASSTGCSRASAPPTISPADARPSWSRWWRPPRSSIRPANARWSSSTRSAAAPRPSTASRSPGPRSSICTRQTAAARCSPRISTS